MKYFLCSKSATGQVFFCYCCCYSYCSYCCLCFSFYFIVHTHTQKTIKNNSNKVNQQIPFQNENILILINTADLLSMCRWSKRTNILREQERGRGEGEREQVMDDTTAQVKSNIHWLSIKKKSTEKNKYFAGNSKGNIHKATTRRFSQNTIT